MLLIIFDYTCCIYTIVTTFVEEIGKITNTFKSANTLVPLADIR